MSFCVHHMCCKLCAKVFVKCSSATAATDITGCTRNATFHPKPMQQHATEHTQLQCVCENLFHALKLWIAGMHMSSWDASPGDLGHQALCIVPSQVCCGFQPVGCGVVLQWSAWTNRVLADAKRSTSQQQQDSLCCQWVGGKVPPVM